jgi:type IV secretion system protein VirB3
MAKKFPLFKGATRVATWFLVPRDVFIVTFMFAASLFMAIHLWALLVFAILWLIEWGITKHDDRMFRIIWLWLKTKVRNMFESSFTRLWGGSSYSPVDYSDRLSDDKRGEV